jgi:hypothetical protein
MIDNLSRRAPSIVVVTLCISLLAAWINAPVWLPTTLAIGVGGLALLLFLARGGRRRVRNQEEANTADERNWVTYELAGQGTPPGFYVLAFFGIVTIALTGFQTPYARPPWAALALGIAWGVANRTYRSNDEADS